MMDIKKRIFHAASAGKSEAQIERARTAIAGRFDGRTSARHYDLMIHSFVSDTTLENGLRYRSTAFLQAASNLSTHILLELFVGFALAFSQEEIYTLLTQTEFPGKNALYRILESSSPDLALLKYQTILPLLARLTDVQSSQLLIQRVSAPMRSRHNTYVNLLAARRDFSGDVGLLAVMFAHLPYKVCTTIFSQGFFRQAALAEKKQRDSLLMVGMGTESLWFCRSGEAVGYGRFAVLSDPVKTPTVRPSSALQAEYKKNRADFATFTWAVVVLNQSDMDPELAVCVLEFLKPANATFYCKQELQQGKVMIFSQKNHRSYALASGVCEQNHWPGKNLSK